MSDPTAPTIDATAAVATASAATPGAAVTDVATAGAATSVAADDGTGVTSADRSRRRAGLAYDGDGRLLVDIRGPRFGAAVTTGVLATALVVRGSVGTVLVAWQVVVFAVTVVAGLAWSPYGEVFRRAKRGLDLGPPPRVELEAAPRFAQLCGLVVAGAGMVALLAGATTLGWVLVGVVLALSTLLATTGICVGCELYLPIVRLRAGLRSTRPARPASVGPSSVGPSSVGPSSVGPSSVNPSSVNPSSVNPSSVGGLRVDHATQSLLGLDPALAGPRAVLFGSATCAPCDTVKAVLDDVRATVHPDLQWGYVDAADHLDVAATHGIRRVPTVLVLDPAGTVVSRSSGVPARADLVAAVGAAAQPGGRAARRRAR